MYKKLKSHLGNDAIFMASLLLGVGIVSFGLGRLSVDGNQVPKIHQTQIGLISGALTPLVATTAALSNVATVTAPIIPDAETARYVGSKSGTKYHLVTCPGAKQIKLENKIYFNTQSEAAAAGYSKAANCPGL